MARTIQRVLVACRGDVAVSLCSSIESAGMEAVAAYTDTDATMPYLDEVAYAVRLGEEEGDPFQVPMRLVSAALDSGADALHPGLACRSAELARTVMNVGLAWVGPTWQQVELCADRAAVRRQARECGLEGVPHSGELEGAPAGMDQVAHFGAPVYVRPVDRRRPGRLARTLDEARAAVTAMGGAPYSVERAILPARHLVVVVIGDGQGNVLHVGEHERSVVDGRRIRMRESPSPGVEAPARKQLGAASVRFAASLRWQGVAGVEWLVGADGRPWLHDLHPGLPGGYTLHDLAYGVDLVQAQLQLASGENLDWNPAELVPSRHAMEVLICATGSGELEEMVLPEGVGVVTAYGPGSVIDVARDPVLARLRVDAPTRHAALVRILAALEQVRIEGVPHDTARLARALGHRDVWDGRTHTGVLAAD